MLLPQDEHWHEPTPARHFNESFYFNAFDRDGGWAVATRVGVTPSTQERDGFVCVYLPDDSTAFVETEERADRGVDLIRAGGLDYVCVEPFEKWRIRYDGPVHHLETRATESDLQWTQDPSRATRHLVLDLEVRPTHPPIDYDERSVRPRGLTDLARGAMSGNPLRTLARVAHATRMLPSMIGAHHYEHATRVRGTVTLDGRSSSFEGHGQRDHSWGVRDMNVPTRWRWLSCQFGDALSFNAVQVDVLAMRVQGGFVLREGSAEPVVRWRLEPTSAAHRYWPEHLKATLVTKGGSQLEVEADISAPLPVVARSPSRSTLVTAARAVYRFGDLVADGMVECMEQLR